MNSSIASILYKFLLSLRKENVKKRLISLRSLENEDKEILFKIKNEKAKRLLIYSKNHVPYYRDRYDFKPKEVEKMSDEEFDCFWKTLPILEKEIVIKNKELFFSDEISEMNWHFDKTSGSTGTPLILKVNSSCWETRHARDLQFKYWHGIKEGERYILFWGEHWSRKSKLFLFFKDFLLNRVRVSAFNHEEEYLKNMFEKITKFKPSYFMGYPSAIFDFCSFIMSEKKDLSFLNLKAVLTTAEPLRDYQREVISKVCGCKVFSQYGGAEQGVAASECEMGKMHIFVDTTYLEPLEDKIDQPVECLATDLELYSMPLIRYNTGDEVVFSDKSCSCGKPYPLLNSVEGRSGYDIILPNGRKINANLPSYIFKEIARKGVIRRYRFIDYGDGKLNLYIVKAKSFSDNDLKILRKEVEKAFGKDIEVIIRFVDTLDNLPNAKHRDYVVVKNERV